MQEKQRKKQDKETVDAVDGDDGVTSDEASAVNPINTNASEKDPLIDRSPEKEGELYTIRSVGRFFRDVAALFGVVENEL